MGLALIKVLPCFFSSYFDRCWFNLKRIFRKACCADGYAFLTFGSSCALEVRSAQRSIAVDTMSPAPPCVLHI